MPNDRLDDRGDAWTDWTGHDGPNNSGIAAKRVGEPERWADQASKLTDWMEEDHSWRAMCWKCGVRKAGP